MYSDTESDLGDRLDQDMEVDDDIESQVDINDVIDLEDVMDDDFDDHLGSQGEGFVDSEGNNS